MSALILVYVILLFLAFFPSDDFVWILKPDTNPNPTENYVIAAVAFLYICGCKTVQWINRQDDKCCTTESFV